MSEQIPKRQKIVTDMKPFNGYLSPTVTPAAVQSFTFSPQSKNKNSAYSNDPTIANTKAHWCDHGKYNAIYGAQRWAQFIIPLGKGPHALLFKRIVDRLGEFIPVGPYSMTRTN